jgi:hypothetical protein
MLKGYTKKDIVDFCESNIGIELEDKGEYYVGLCPLHSETNPSFTVYPKTQRYHCWACDPNGGDIIDLYMKLHNTNFKTALENVCDKQDDVTFELGDFTNKSNTDLWYKNSYSKIVRKLYSDFEFEIVLQKEKQANDIINKYQDYNLAINFLIKEFYGSQTTI